LIADTKGNFFGGFTPVKWEAPVWNGNDEDLDALFRGDDSLRSFLFRVRNPRGVSPRKFALRAERMQYAIRCCAD
jgi:hypothetical protein